MSWDIAIASNGPAIIEGNVLRSRFQQLPGQTPGNMGIMPTLKY